MTLCRFLLELFPDIQGYKPNSLDEEKVRSLFSNDPQRLSHIFGVMDTAKRLGPQLPGDSFSNDLEMAALFHDIGYAPPLRKTGFHPLDGAIFLTRYGAPEQVVDAVIRHSGAETEAMHHPEISSIYSRLPHVNNNSLLVDALTFCDLRTSSGGHRSTLRQRCQDIELRYGSEHAVSRNLRKNISVFQSAFDRVLRQIAINFHVYLPWLFVDIDGTLICPGEQISSGNSAALKAYMDSGGKVSLATGKHPLAIKSLISDFGLTGPHVAGNGSVIIVNRQTEVIGGIGRAGMEISFYLRSQRVPHAVYTANGIFVESSLVQPEHLHQLTRISEPEPMFRSLSDGMHILKVLCFIPEGDLENENRLRNAAAQWGTICVRTSDNFLEFHSPIHGKDAAANYIFRKFNWPCFHSIAIGDCEDDIPLLRVVGQSLSVANGSESVRSIVDRIIPECGADGVALLLNQIRDEALLPEE